jgi:hypothetical protein
MIKYYYEDRADIIKTVIKLIEGFFGVKKGFSGEGKGDVPKNETIQKTPELDKLSHSHLEKLKEMRNVRKASN